jgi:hypothetical protein
MSNLTVKGNASGTGTIILESPNTNTSSTVTLPDATTTLVGTADFASQAQAEAGTDNATLMTPLRTAQAIAVDASPILTFSTNTPTTSGTAFDFTGLASTVTEIEVFFQAVSLTGTSGLIVQLIVSGTPLTTGYTSSSGTSGAETGSTAGFFVFTSSAAQAVSGIMSIVRAASGIWVEAHSISLGSADANGGGFISGVGTVTGIRLTRPGADTFDAGNVAISYR